MNNFRNEMNQNERIARTLTGIDSESTTFVLNGERADEILAREKQIKFNQQKDEMADRIDSYMEQLNDLGNQLAHNMNNVEIMPVYSNVIIEPFKDNPFQKVEIDKTTGLIVDLGGLAPEYKSQETGEVKEEEQMVRVGTVIEVGHTCQFVEPGDVVMWTRFSEAPLPFYRTGFVKVSEQNILAVINEKLTDRRLLKYGK